MPNQRNKQQVKQLTQELNQAQAAFLLEYQGLSANDLNQLRREIRHAQGKLQVSKNRLIMLAARRAWGVEIDRQQLTQTTAVLFAYQDPVLPLKAAVKFAKDHKLPKIKLGLFQKQLLTAQQTERLAKLPDTPVLQGQVVGMLASPLSRLVGSLQANLQKLVIALSEIEKQKSN